MNDTYDGLLGQPTAIVATPPVVPIAVPLITLIAAPAAPAAPASTATLSSPPPARYLHPSTARDRLNYTLNSLAIGPESVQPTTTAIIPPRMQTPTPTAL